MLKHILITMILFLVSCSHVNKKNREVATSDSQNNAELIFDKIINLNGIVDGGLGSFLLTSSRSNTIVVVSCLKDYTSAKPWTEFTIRSNASGRESEYVFTYNNARNCPDQFQDALNQEKLVRIKINNDQKLSINRMKRYSSAEVTFQNPSE